MPPLELDVRTDLSTDPWVDLDARTITHGVAIRVGVRADGTENGDPVVAVLVELDDGGCVMAETTLTLARVAAAAIGDVWGRG